MKPLSMLEDDPSLKDLIHKLALSDRFSFQILVCNPPMLTRSILQMISGEVSEIRNESSPFFVIEPYSGLGPDQRPLDFYALVSRALEPLLALPKDLPKSALVYLDASRASPDEDEAWKAIFHKMNELRNHISQVVPFPFTLCLPPGLDTIFAREASDFWSIRSAVASVELRYEHTAPLFSPRVWSEPPRVASSVNRIDTLQKELEIAQARAQEDQESPESLYTLLLAYKSLAEAQQKAGNISQSTQPFLDALTLTQKLKELAPQRREEWLWEQLGIAVSLSDIYIDLTSPKAPEQASQLLQENIQEVLQFLSEYDEPKKLNLFLGPAYLNLSKALEDLGDLEGSERWCYRALGVWEATGFRSGQARAHEQLGRLARQQGDENAARGFFARAIDLFERINEKNKLAQLYLQQGGLDFERGDLNAAEQSYRRALDIFSAHRDVRESISARHQLGIIAIERGNLEEAEEQFKSVIAGFEVLNDKEGAARGYHELGIIAANREDFAQAEEWYQQSLSISKETSNSKGQAQTLVCMGTLALQKGALDDANKALHAALDLAEREDQPLVYYNLAMVAAQNNQIEESMRFLILSIASFSHQGKLLGMTILRLAQLEETLGEERLKEVWTSCTNSPISPSLLRTIREINQRGAAFNDSLSKPEAG